MRRYLSILISAIVFLLQAAPVAGQEYIAPEVTVSDQKVNLSGKIYYLHKVLPKQTVYSICKAYGVTEEELLEANPSVRDGLRQGSLLYIPVATVQSETNETGSGRDSGEGKLKWYEKLFGKRSSNTGREVQESRPDEETITVPDTIYVYAEAPEEDASAPAEQQTSVFSEENPVRVSLVLPMDVSGTPSEKYIDFYCGALQALEELKGYGYSVILDVYDLRSGNPLTESRLRESSIIIGPVHSADMKPFVEFACDNRIPVVSPLDYAAESFTEGNPYFIQAPASDSIQMVNLLASINPQYGDKVYIFYNSTLKEQRLVERIKNALDLSGIEYNNLAYDILKGRELGQRLSRQWSGNSRYKIIVASEDESFAPDVIRNISLIARGNIKVSTYCSNTMRGFEDALDYNTLYNANAHVSAPYFVDYEDADTHAFVYEYRALFNAEPTAFSFQGHDLVTYFVTTLYNAGRIDDLYDLEEQSLLQCNLHFVRDDKNSGWRNIATRNLIYNPDFTISVEK
ncbi:MAG: ABC transporter substrate-binding protein [Bacteroidales bacterium]|nr:ABC transporter substrate-binding protein [Candidatus Cacconaster merdequi]